MDEPEPEDIDLSPSKETYEAVQSDVTPISAVRELVDNAIDNWERVYNRSQDLEIDIYYSPEDDEFQIVDNSGGLEEENIAKLFALGESTKEDIDTPIGAYGVGAKKAIVKLGQHAELVSRYREQEYGYGYEVDQEWLSNSDSWSVTKKPYTDIEAGKTRITITNLNFDLEEIEGVPEAPSSSSEKTSEFIKTLRADLKHTYEELLRQEFSFGGDVIIRLNGTQVKSPGSIDWSFTPFDGYHPRKYKNINLRRHNLEHNIYLDIVVGLTRTGSQDQAGTDIFCQRRKVISNNSGEVGGFGRDELDVGELSATNSRIKVRLYFRTEGNADRLPWDTQKDGIDQYDSLMQEAYEWFDKIVYQYWQASSYDKMPGPFVKPYTHSTRYAANNGVVEQFDYENRTRLSDRPDQQFSDTEKIENTIKEHLSMGISAPNQVPPQFRLAYRKYVEKHSSTRTVTLSPPQKISTSALRETVSEVRELAKSDTEEKQYRDVDDEWWGKLYESLIEEEQDTLVEWSRVTSEGENIRAGETAPSGGQEKEPTQPRDGFQASTNSAGGDSSERSPDSSNDTSTPEQKTLDEDQEDTANPNEGSSSSDRSDLTSSQEANMGNSVKDTSTQNQTDSAIEQDEETNDSEREIQEDSPEDSEGGTTQFKEPESSSSSVGLTTSSRGSQGPESPTGFKEINDGHPPIVLTFSEEEWADLTSYFDLDDEASAEVLADQLKEHIVEELLSTE